MTLAETVRAAIADMTENGFDSMERVNRWLELIRAAAMTEFMPEHELTELVRDTLRVVYERQINQGVILRHHPNVPRFTLDRLRPELHHELERRILASAQLIKMNRSAAIERTLQRFSGWATSLPVGGTTAQNRREEAKEIRKALAQLPFHERRVAIDQGHKFNAALSATIALNGGAIAAIWHSHWRQPGYNYREAHKVRDLDSHGSLDAKPYCVRGNWAYEAGFMTKGSGFTDQITQPAEEPFCRCFWQWLYNLRDLPQEMLTAAGRRELERVKVS